jgi:hypothetical protein
MSTRLYDHLIKPLSVGNQGQDSEGRRSTFNNGPGGAAQKVWLTGPEHLEGLPLNFTWGLHRGVGNWHAGHDWHIHPYPECHLFVGLNPADINYLGAEIECQLGAEQQKYSFREPTVVVIPAGLPHGPVVTKEIFSPQGFASYLVALNDRPQTIWLENPTPPADSTANYPHLVKSLKSFILTEHGKFKPSRFKPEQAARRAEDKSQSRLQLGPGNSDHLTWMFGASDLGGLDVNLDWGFFSHPGLWHRGVGAHVHATPEVLVFVGTDPASIDYLGAEIEIDLGKEHESHIIDKPSVVICPAGFPHAPIVTRWADRPFAFFSINRCGESKMVFID